MSIKEIDEAIKVKEAYHKKYEKHMLSSERFADRLSIEALKCVYYHRKTGEYPICSILPGETKE